MSNTTDAEEFRTLARKHHIHYDIEPEIVLQGTERVKVGFAVRLWAVHPKGAKALPGCPQCAILVEDLRGLARWLVPAEERPTRADLEPFRPALYDSREIPGADEVMVAIRLVHREGYERPVDACEERCLKEIRERLRELGIPER
jgi:hypothetical protein